MTRGGDDDERKRHLEEEDSDKGGRSDEPVDGPAQRPAPKAYQRLDHDREHGGLYAREQRRNQGRLAVGPVEDRQRKHESRTRRHEQQACGKAALGAMQTPAGVGRELHRLGPRQQHAEAQGGQESPLAEPAPLVDQHTVHEGDLCRRATEGLQADGAEDAAHLPERGGGVGANGVVSGYGRLVAHACLQKRLETALGHVPRGAAASAPERPNLNAEA